MKVFVAGAAGAIGRPLVQQLLAAGHEVVGTTRDAQRAAALRERGAEAVVLDAFDREAVRRAVLAAEPEVVVHELTALPETFSPKALKAALERTSALRRETVPYFLEAAREAGARRTVVQSISFATRPDGTELHDETTPLWLDAPGQFRPTVEAVSSMEEATVAAGGVVLRYGFYYGPGTWYAPDGAIGRMIAKRRMPLIGAGRGRMSWVHVDDAAAATVAALDRGAPGIYNVCDDEPARQTEWLPEAARLMGARAPRRIPAWLARLVAGPVAVHYAETIVGNANAKARAELAFAPRSWREGFAEVYGAAAAPASAGAGAKARA